jgi:hypothetical protein
MPKKSGISAFLKDATHWGAELSASGDNGRFGRTIHRSELVLEFFFC